MDEVWRRIERWLKANAPEVLHGLADGASEQEINSLQVAVDALLPEEMKASYRIHSGHRSGLFEAPQLLGRWHLNSLEAILEEWSVCNELVNDGDFEGYKSVPEGPISEEWWNTRWIPFTSDAEGNHLCVDLDAAPGGVRGQVITMWHDDASRS